MSFPKQVAPRSPVINRDSGSTLYRHSGQDPSAETGQECCRSRFENFPRARTAHARGFGFPFFEVRIRRVSHLFIVADLGQLKWVQLPTRRRDQVRNSWQDCHRENAKRVERKLGANPVWRGAIYGSSFLARVRKFL